MKNWSKNPVVNEIFSVIVGGQTAADFPSDFLKEYDNSTWSNPVKILETWVEQNDVKNFKIHLVKSDIEDLMGDVDTYINDIKNFTDKEIVLHDDNDGEYFGIYLDKFNIDWDFEEWNHEFREDLKYSDKYFYNGSDASLYTLIEKI